MDIQWPLVVFTLLTGAGGWLFAFVAANEFVGASKKDGFVPGIAALALIVVGGFASVLHLSHPDRIMNALTHPTSGIFVEAALCGVAALAIIVYLICLKRGAKGAAKALGAIGAVVGIVLSFMAGWSYVVMSSHAAWATVLLPVAYLGTAVPVGAALYWALACPDAENGSRFAALATAVGGAAALVALLAYGAAAAAFGGTALPYFAAALCCAVVAIVMGFVGKGKSGSLYALVAVVAAAAGALLFRAMMWIIGTGAYNFFD